MIYGIENISLVAPFSFLFSVILFLVLFFVGDFFQKHLLKELRNISLSIIIFFSLNNWYIPNYFFIIHYFNF